MFARFVCDLLAFCARKFPEKSGKIPGHLLLTKSCIYVRCYKHNLLYQLYNNCIFISVFELLINLNSNKNK